MKINLSENIKFYRKVLGLSQEELGNKIFCEQNRISRYEKGTRAPDIETLCILAVLFDVTLEDLVEYDKKEILEILAHSKKPKKD